jgi:Lon protease-like protein
MSDDAEKALQTFGGTARLFPLPNLVLFPHAVQPLHIFEPRYRQLLADTLDSDRLMALVMLQPGWEEDYHQSPAIHAVACLGRVAAEQRLPDGRYNLLLHGLRRARILDEVPGDRMYRTARVELLEDVPPAGTQEEELRRRLTAAAQAWYSAKSEDLAQLRQLFKHALPLGVLSDVFASALPLEPPVKQQLLEEVRVEQRVKQLLTFLESHHPDFAGASRKFPPDFSPN